MDSSHGTGSQLELVAMASAAELKGGRSGRPQRRQPPRAEALLPAGIPYALHERDAVEWLRELPDETVDLFITDPPYESLEKHRAIGTTTRLKHSKSSSNDWFRIFPNSRFP